MYLQGIDADQLAEGCWVRDGNGLGRTAIPQTISTIPGCRKVIRSARGSPCAAEIHLAPHGKPHHDRLRLVATAAAGSLCLAVDACLQRDGKRPLTKYMQEAFKNLKAEIRGVFLAIGRRGARNWLGGLAL